MSETTLLWHDYETWGLDPRKDRAAQFAALRTNLDLEVIEKPLVLYCRPSGDFLPHPEAVILTGITPQRAAAKGVNEAQFFSEINTALSRPGTCGVGYNSLRFDDEFTRFGFYRNFIDPYAREHQRGTSRWDIIDLFRTAYALRPEDLCWPEKDEQGTISFTLEDLAHANQIIHEPHDALSDVRACLGLAHLLKTLKPRLYEYCFKLRHKQEAAALLNMSSKEVVLHVSGMYPSSKGCIAPVIPLLQHPRNRNEFIVYDLRENPEEFVDMEAEDLRFRLYSPQKELPEGCQRLPLKGVHVNKAPVLAPVNTLSPEQAEKWGIDWQVVEQHRKTLLSAGNRFSSRLLEVYGKTPEYPTLDADEALYTGFIADRDRRLCELVRQKQPEHLAEWEPDFTDSRLKTLYFRYRARNWPESLNPKEQEVWANFCQDRILRGQYGNALTWEKYQQILEAMAKDGTAEQHTEAFRQLVEWVQSA
jgi:exodeoxyribonuclease I